MTGPALLLALALLQGGAPAAPASPAAAPIRMGVLVRPETVTVGDPFRVVIRVSAPAGARIVFPDGPDSAAAVEALDPRTTAAGETAGEQIATYRLAAWDIGEQLLELGDVVVTTADGERRIPLGDASVFVRSVLPRDTALRVPKPARDIIEPPVPWWRHWWIWAIVGAAIFGLLLWWWWRRRRRRKTIVVADPYAHAQREFARIEAMGLLEAGERGRFVALVVEVVREYLAARVPAAPRSLTTSELLTVIRGLRSVPADRLATVLAEADLVKFARRPVAPERARELAREARAIVDEVERRERVRREADAAAARMREAA